MLLSESNEITINHRVPYSDSLLGGNGAFEGILLHGSTASQRSARLETVPFVHSKPSEKPFTDWD